MLIECPHCGRVGNLPDHLALAAQTLRCRRCSSRFRSGGVPIPGADQRLGVPIEPPPVHRAAELAAPFLADGFFAGFDEPEPSLRHGGPGDSQYELTFTLEESPGEFSPEWTTEAAAGDEEGPSGEIAAPRGLDGSLLEPWYFRIIASSGRFLFLGGLILAALALPLMLWLLLRLVAGSRSEGATSLVLAVVSVATLAALLLALSTSALNVLLIDVARDIRRLRDHADRDARVVRE